MLLNRFARTKTRIKLYESCHSVDIYITRLVHNKSTQTRKTKIKIPYILNNQKSKLKNPKNLFNMTVKFTTTSKIRDYGDADTPFWLIRAVW